MKRHLVWILVVAWFGTGCAVRPASEAQVLASKIAREQPSQTRCKVGDIRYCDVDYDGQLLCGCVDARSFGSR